MDIKKVVIFLVIVSSLILLLGSTGSNMKLQNGKAKCEHVYGEAAGWRQNIDEYTIVHDPNLNKLQDDVRKRLDDSWQPIGGISFVKNEYYQVMIK
jgi:hypothetical protein